MVERRPFPERREFYVYVIFRENGAPCYVGKGRKGRWLDHQRKAHNPHLRRIYAKAGGALPVAKVRVDLTDTEACATEIALIAAIGRGRDGPLVNMTDGGDGLKGWVPSQETRTRISEANTGHITSAETRAKMSAVRAGKPMSSEQLKRMMVGRHIWLSSEGAHEKLSDAARKRWSDPEKRAKQAASVARSHDEMSIEKKVARSAAISAGTKTAFLDPALRKKISDARCGKPLTPAQVDVLVRMAEANRGSGRPRSELQTRALASMHSKNAGRHHSEETKAKMRASHARRLGLLQEVGVSQ
jgi:hypothetical protein